MTADDWAAVTFIALALFREDRGGTPQERLAIAYTIMTRVAEPGWWGHDVQSVLFDKDQYSSLTASGDPQAQVWPVNSIGPIWQDCLKQALAAYTKSTPNPVPGADSYFDDSIKRPYWATDANFIAKIGRLNFHRVKP